MRFNRPLLPLLAVAFALQGCFFACADEVTRRATSPDGQWLAAAFVRNCGATTDFVTHVVIVEAGEAPDDSGDVLVAQAGQAPPAAKGGPDVQLRWLGPKRLLITYDAGTEIFLQAIRRRGITIDYQETPGARKG